MRPSRHRSLATRAAAVAIGAAGVALGAWWMLRSPAPRALPDVIFLSVDTLRADHLGVGGRHPSPTPNLDRLAAEGTYFRQAITPMPRTTPGLASLLTGLWPHHHGSREVGEPILAGTTMAQLLQKRGYTTLAVSANSTAGPREGLAAGFDRFVTHEDIVEQHGPRLYRDLTPAPSDGVGWGEAVTDEALRLVEAVDHEGPVFLWVFYFDPHFLYRPPSPWQDEIAADRCWDLYAWGEKNLARAGEVITDRYGQASEALEDCSALYEGEVAYTDHEIGRLVRGLRRLGRFGDALVVFAADHGESLGEDGLFFEHGDNVHDAVLRVPLLFRGPGVARGRIDDEAASLVDVAPTLLSLLGWPQDERPSTDGRDLTPRLDPGGRPPDPEPRITFAESATSMWNEAFQHLTTGRRGLRACVNGPRFTLCRSPAGEFHLYDREVDPALEHDVSAGEPVVFRELHEAFERWPPETARYRAARTARVKLVQTPLLEGGYRETLYDLEADPEEKHDALDRHREEAGRLRSALDRWTEGLAAPGERDEDLEQLEKLRRLGYVE